MHMAKPIDDGTLEMQLTDLICVAVSIQSTVLEIWAAGCVMYKNSTTERSPAKNILPLGQTDHHMQSSRNNMRDFCTSSWPTDPAHAVPQRRGICSWLGEYWRVAIPPKTSNELDAEQWLFVVGLRRGRFWSSRPLFFQRWYLALLTLLTQGIIGCIYSFNTMAPSIDGFFGVETNSIHVYLISTLSLGVAGALEGPFLERKGPRTGMTLGCVFFCLGLVLAQVAITVKSLALLYVGFGVLAGVGHGILLISSMSTLLKWFPDWRGFVTGICVAGMGLGTALWNTLYDNMLLTSPSGSNGPGSLNYLFALTASVSLVILILSAMVLRTPPPTFTVNGHDIHSIPASAAPNHMLVQDEFLNVGMTLVNYAALEPRHTILSTDKEYFQQVKALTLVQCIFSTDFFWLFIVFAANLTPTVLFLPQVNDTAVMVLHKQPKDATDFLNRMTITTSIGVVVAPLLSDLVIRIFYANPAYARKMIFFIMVAVQAVTLGLLMNAWKDLDLWLWYGVGFCIGGGFGVIPSLVSDMFGVYNSGTMYGLILTSRAVGAVVVGFLLPSMQHTENSIQDQFTFMFVFAIVGAAMMIFVRTNTMDRFFHGYQLTLCSKVVIQIPFRTSSAGPNLVEKRKITATMAPNDAFFLMSPARMSSISVLSPDMN
ncbi:hypothetical protein AC1031_010242 [Aphanomyces cochlioides]|nr:hypothetical protein AC1031_010242 [Aphanomyces cochlioides]